MSTPAMELSNEQVLEFIELYQREPALWDPTNKSHKNRNILADSWERIRSSFSVEGITIADLKRKKESLMTTYRYLLNKKKRSIKSGVGVDDIYQTNWFAYHAMDCFLGQNYESKPIQDTESRGIQQEEKSTGTLNRETPQEQRMTQGRTGEGVVRSGQKVKTAQTQKKDKTFAPPSQIQHLKKQKQRDDDLQVMTTAIRRQQDLDETDYFCQMLAEKMKKMDDAKRDKLMYDIHALVYNSKYTLSPSNSPPVFSDTSSDTHEYVSQSPAQGYRNISAYPYKLPSEPPLYAVSTSTNEAVVVPIEYTSHSFTAKKRKSKYNHEKLYRKRLN